MSAFFHVCCFFILSLFLSDRASADISSIDIKTATSVYLNNHLEMLEDETGNLLLSDVITPDANFHLFSSRDKHWDKGFTQSTFWFRVKLRNVSPETDWYYQQWGSLNRSVKLYLATGNAETVEDFVPLQPLAHARLIQYHLSLPKHAEQVLYLRIQDKQIPLMIHLSLLPATHLIKWTVATYPMPSFLVGGLLILALYNFLYFLQLHDKGFLYLSVFILTFTLEIGGHMGLWQSISWMRENLNSVDTLFGFLCVASVINLLRHFLKMSTHFPRLNSSWRYAFWVSVGFAVACPWIPFSSGLLGVWAFFLSLWTSLSFILFYRRGLHLPRGMSLATIIVILSGLPTLLMSLGLIEQTISYIELAVAGLLLALMFLSLAQAEQMREKNERAERIKATNQTRGEFLTTMSHELRTPMTAVVSAGQLLQLSGLSETQREYVTRLNTSSQHMISLINNILDLARLDNQALAIESTPFQLSDVLSQTEQLLADQISQTPLSLMIDNHFSALRQRLLGDPLRLRQVLLNLLNNAIKFTPQGDVKLTITPQLMTDHTATLLFEVRDTGIGLSKEQQQYLFQPFSQLDSSISREYGGSGLGLSISSRLIACMGGELQVDSEPERGSCFFFTLTFPWQAALPQTADIKTHPSMVAAPFNHLQILLVDDNEMNRFFCARMLESLGAKVTLVENGQQALHTLQQSLRHCLFDMVFMDISMPGLDGYATSREIQANPAYQQVSVVAFTAHAIAGERERCLAAGMQDFLSKPFMLKELKAVLNRYQLKKETVNSNIL